MTEDSRCFDCHFTRAEWARLGISVPPPTDAEQEKLLSISHGFNIDEVAAIYGPLAAFVSTHVALKRARLATIAATLGRAPATQPYLLGVTGSVAVGKTAIARALQVLLARHPGHPRVEVVSTDGFLWPNAVLDGRGLLDRKGHPETYDHARMVRFVRDVARGASSPRVPRYSHAAKDIVAGDDVIVPRSDIVVVEGINLLQTCDDSGGPAEELVSDHLDHVIYIDASAADIERWYCERFVTRTSNAARADRGFYLRFAALPTDVARATAQERWRRINAPNMRENVVTTRGRADLGLEKHGDHRVVSIGLRTG
jgi:type I pantothenate kinase